MFDKTSQNSCLEKNISRIIDLSNDDDDNDDVDGDSDVEYDHCNGHNDDHDKVGEDDAHDHAGRGQKSKLC